MSRELPTRGTYRSFTEEDLVRVAKKGIAPFTACHLRNFFDMILKNTNCVTGIEDGAVYTEVFMPDGV